MINSDLAFKKILCNSALSVSISETHEIIKGINKTIKEVLTMTRQKQKPKVKPKVKLTLLLKNTIGKHTPKLTSQTLYYKKVGTLSRFFSENDMADDVTTMNQKTMRKFRDWLEARNCAVTAKQTLNTIARWLKAVEQEHEDIRFNIDLSLIPPIKEMRTRDEKKGNGIALTAEEIESLKNADNLTDTEKRYRDLFIIQCQCGIRCEDFPRLLNSKNHIEKEGVLYASFITEKKKVRANIPLNSVNLYPDTLEIMRPYIDDKAIMAMKSATDTDNMRNRLNQTIKKIAKKVGLDREIEESHTMNGRVVKERKLLFEKLSSHDARRTFVTNCVRVFHLTPSQIIPMSGHSDSDMIERVYTVLTSEDKLSQVHEALKSVSINETRKKQREKIEALEAVEEDNRGISSNSEAENVLLFLGDEEIRKAMTFEDMVNRVKSKESYLLNEYGIQPSTLKNLYGYGLPLMKRKKALEEIVKAFN